MLLTRNLCHARDRFLVRLRCGFQGSWRGRGCCGGEGLPIVVSICSGLEMKACGFWVLDSGSGFSEVESPPFCVRVQLEGKALCTLQSPTPQPPFPAKNGQMRQTRQAPSHCRIAFSNEKKEASNFYSIIFFQCSKHKIKQLILSDELNIQKLSTNYS